MIAGDVCAPAFPRNLRHRLVQVAANGARTTGAPREITAAMRAKNRWRGVAGKSINHVSVSPGRSRRAADLAQGAAGTRAAIIESPLNATDLRAGSASL